MLRGPTRLRRSDLEGWPARYPNWIFELESGILCLCVAQMLTAVNVRDSVVAWLPGIPGKLQERGACCGSASGAGDQFVVRALGSTIADQGQFSCLHLAGAEDAVGRPAFERAERYEGQGRVDKRKLRCRTMILTMVASEMSTRRERRELTRSPTCASASLTHTLAIANSRTALARPALVLYVRTADAQLLNL